MYECERMLGLDLPTQDWPCCDWCGEPSDSDICAACQQRYEEEHADEA